MKKVLLVLAMNLSLATCYALGPNEITFNGVKYYKDDEKQQNNAIIAEYSALDANISSSIILTHVLNKDDPSQIAQGLKTKKSIEVIDIESLNNDNTDMLVSFVKFDVPNLKVQNNLCRIKRNTDKEGSFVFQYMETKKFQSQSEGAILPDFTHVTQKMKHLAVDKYLNGISSPPPTYADYPRTQKTNLPWYKRPKAWAGKRASEYQRTYRYR